MNNCQLQTLFRTLFGGSQPRRQQPNTHGQKMHTYRIAATQNGWSHTRTVQAYNFQHARRKAVNEIKRDNLYNGYIKVRKITQVD
jgi:hypothetical protein